MYADYFGIFTDPNGWISYIVKNDWDQTTLFTELVMINVYDLHTYLHVWIPYR